jgi:hypothetical protein
MDDADWRLMKLVQQLDDERQRRVKAERQLNASKATVAQLRNRLAAVTTRDQAPPPPGHPRALTR